MGREIGLDLEGLGGKYDENMLEKFQNTNKNMKFDGSYTKVFLSSPTTVFCDPEKLHQFLPTWRDSILTPQMHFSPTQKLYA